MKNLNETDALNEAIIMLQQKRAYELLLLKEQLHTSSESLKPINLIKSTFREVSSSPSIKNNIIDNAIGLGTGFLTKKLLVGNTHSPIRRLFGTMIHFAIANVVSKHTDIIKSTGENLLNRYQQYRKDSRSEFHHNDSE